MDVWLDGGDDVAGEDEVFFDNFACAVRQEVGAVARAGEAVVDQGLSFTTLLDLARDDAVLGVSVVDGLLVASTNRHVTVGGVVAKFGFMCIVA